MSNIAPHATRLVMIKCVRNYLSNIEVWKSLPIEVRSEFIQEIRIYSRDRSFVQGVSRLSFLEFQQ